MIKYVVSIYLMIVSSFVYAGESQPYYVCVSESYKSTIQHVGSLALRFNKPDQSEGKVVKALLEQSAWSNALTIESEEENAQHKKDGFFIPADQNQSFANLLKAIHDAKKSGCVVFISNQVKDKESNCCKGIWFEIDLKKTPVIKLNPSFEYYCMNTFSVIAVILMGYLYILLSHRQNQSFTGGFRR